MAHRLHLVMPAAHVERTYKLCPTHFGKGRLGHLYDAVECASGTIVSVEEVQLLVDVPDAFEFIYATIETELQEMATLRDEHLVEYIGVTSAEKTLYLVMEHTAGGTLSKVLQDFGRLHRAIIPSYVYRLVCGLQALHTHGMVHGRLSSASVFTGAHGHLKIGSYFPSLATTQYIMEHHPIAGKLVTPHVTSLVDGVCRDLRAVGWLVAEMLIGTQIRGIHVDVPRILAMVQDFPLEHAFLSTLFDVINDTMRSQEVGDYTSTLLGHEYLQPSTVAHLLLEPAPAPMEDLTLRLELETCLRLRSELSVEVEAWMREFQMTTGRHPKRKEWPASVMDKQVRLRTLKVRLQELQEHVQKEAMASMVICGRATNTTALRAPAVDSARKRSTAQTAFLAQNSSRTSLGVDSEVDDSTYGDDDEVASGPSRAAKQHVLHQRREVARLTSSFAEHPES
ncbi:serine/threonine protein kinase [Saprolegnia diclina VS20]|uniref:Serine/threonine protein kinase n=1 Tax=Saprolegnia diclina (strain VS20) TaxID=1156394 RepID=T0S1B0_SAPDV|nr:serine/threonine protein kinase [Saprolegnia diclina VS20]EQC38778.1 serine/threonine protein kinase [Saprolegnia diclina VS20]|eukprot:XP_008607602.1 serine/threonine protein kinase [Saprolegnia diclina VS20]